MYSDNAQSNPQGPTLGATRVSRGGNWAYGDQYDYFVSSPQVWGRNSRGTAHATFVWASAWFVVQNRTL